MRTCGLLFLGLALVASAKIPSEDLSPSPQISFRLAIESPIVRRLQDLSFSFYPEFQKDQGLKVHEAEWEIRDSTFQHRFTRVPAYGNFSRDGIRDERPEHTDIGKESLDQDELRLIGALSPGTYYLALIVNGVRASNVIQFQVDPAFDPAKAAVFTLQLYEPAPGRRFAHLLLWVIGPTPEDAKLTNFTLWVTMNLYVDGKLVSAGRSAWDGVVVPIHPQESWCIDYDLAPNPYFYPSLDVSLPHDYRIQVGKYISNTLHADLTKHPWADAWDCTAVGPTGSSR